MSKKGGDFRGQSYHAVKYARCSCKSTNKPTNHLSQGVAKWSTHNIPHREYAWSTQVAYNEECAQNIKAPLCRPIVFQHQGVIKQN